jgi:hypothetical protein
MKTLLVNLLFFIPVLHLKAQEKTQLNQYYRFKSTCHYIYTTTNSTILTLYSDSTFLLESYSIKRGGEQLYTQSTFSGKWSKRNDTLSFQYFDRNINAIAGNGKNVFSADQTLLSQVPDYCVIVGDMLITNSNLIDNFHISKSKAWVLNEKWAYENESMSKRVLNDANRKLKLGL